MNYDTEKVRYGYRADQELPASVMNWIKWQYWKRELGRGIMWMLIGGLVAVAISRSLAV